NVALGEHGTKQRCAGAYDEAQVAMRQGKLLDAKRQLIYCSSSECPEIMHGDCQHWLSEVEASMPTVVFRVESSSGPAPDAGSVSVDGAEPVPIEGRALSIDPGKHDLTFSAPGYRVSTKALVFAEGEKLRREVVVLDPLPLERRDKKGRQASPPKKEPGSLGSKSVPPDIGQPDSGSSLTLPIVIAATAALAGGVGVTYFGLKARSEDHDLDTCTPNCSRDRVDRIKQEYLLANASIGVAAAGFAVTTLLLFLELNSEKPSQSAQLRVGAQPSGLTLSVGGRF
ncbi:MAG: hypothetical protein ACM3ZE_04290, partial [Myxococcales bacterium]